LIAMSDIERRRGSRMTRKQREERAYRLVLATGAFGLIGAAGIVLAILNVIGGFWPVMALVVAVICFMLLRRTLGR
jgi:fatty acid desaturase